MRSAFFLSTAKQAVAVDPIIFDFDFEQTSKFTLDGSNNVLSYTDRGITLLPYHTGTSDIKMEAGGVRVGSGAGANDGSCLAVSYSNPNIKEIFLVVAEGRKGLSSVSYDRQLFFTRTDSVVTINGVQMLLNNLNIRTGNFISNVSQSHTLRRMSAALSDASITGTVNTLSFGAVNTFKIVRLTLPTHNGQCICLGKNFNGTTIGANGGGAHPTFKRAILANCTPSQGDTILADLRTKYGI